VPVVCTIEHVENDDIFIYSSYSGFIWQPQFGS